MEPSFFLRKVTARNIFRYKKRFFMTVIGIAGCSALLVAGFGINDSISDIVHQQYEVINHFEASINVSNIDDNFEQTLKKAKRCYRYHGRRYTSSNSKHC